MILNVLGMDPSMRNWGVCSATVDSHYLEDVEIKDISVIQTEKITSKTMRTNCIDLDTARQLADRLLPIPKVHAIFSESPVGSQSGSSMKSYGMCMGLLGAIQSETNNIITVSSSDIKVLLGGSKKTSKKAIIEYAYDLYPNLDWPVKTNGKIILGEAEHIADAIGAVLVGILSDEFKQLVNSINQIEESYK